MKLAFRKPRAIAPSVQLPHSNADDHGHPQNCLNCGAALVGAYCHDCGQSAHTHRYSLLHFLMHDFVHGVWHVEKNILRTLWEVMIRPGITARKNIAGQRVRYFPIITLLLLLTGAYLALHHNDVLELSENSQVVIGSWDLTKAVKHYQKWMFLGTIPFLALCSLIIYHKSRHNYSEHLVVACYALASIFAWLCLLFMLPETTADWLDWLLPSLLFGFGVFVQWQAYGNHYTNAGFAWRALLFWVLFTLLLTLILIALIAYAAETGKIKIE